MATLGYVEPFSFRAEFLHACEDMIPEGTRTKGHESCLAPGLATLGQELRACASSYARDRHVEQIEFVTEVNFEEKSPERKLHITYFAA